MDQFNRELIDLFAQYKEAVPDPDPSANFMPELHAARMQRIRKLTRVFVGAAAAVSLLLAMIEVVPRASNSEVHGSYVDALAAANPADNLAALGIAPHDTTDPRGK